MKACFILIHTSILGQLLCLLLPSSLTKPVEAAGSDAENECYRRAVSCIQCSTESALPESPGVRYCRDPFDPHVKAEFKRLHNSATPGVAGSSPAAIVKYNISTVMCDGFCIKWVKVPLSGGETNIVRTCSTTMDIRFSQNTPVCISESRTGKGTICFCRENMCNSATDSRPTSMMLLNLSLIFLYFAKQN